MTANISSLSKHVLDHLGVRRNSDLPIRCLDREKKEIICYSNSLSTYITIFTSDRFSLFSSPEPKAHR